MRSGCAHVSLFGCSENESMNGTNAKKDSSDREVIRCKTCGLVQYRTRMGNCRRCLRLPSNVDRLIQPTEPQVVLDDDRRLWEKSANCKTVENIGQRIRQLRKSHRMTQCQLQRRSTVSHSWLSRIESGQMTPGLATLEKLSDALGVSMNRFLVPESSGEAFLGDSFIQGLRPFLRQLDWEQWKSILKHLASISCQPRAIASPGIAPVSSNRRHNAPADSSPSMGHPKSVRNWVWNRSTSPGRATWRPGQNHGADTSRETGLLECGNPPNCT